MSKQYIFRVQVLNIQETVLQQVVATLSGETQYDRLNVDKNLQVVNSTTNDKVIWNSLVLPERYEQQDMFRELPDYLKYKTATTKMVANARNVLWQNVVSQELRANSQLARLFSLSIPHFFTSDEASTLVTKFSKILVNSGMIVDSSIHDHNNIKKNLSILDKLNILQGKQTIEEINKEPMQDYSGYLLCTLREYKDGYFQNKNRTWNAPQNVLAWRKTWVFMLYDAILNSTNGTPEEISNWNKKMKIYPEYEEVKVHFNNINNIEPLSFNHISINDSPASKPRIM